MKKALSILILSFGLAGLIFIFVQSVLLRGSDKGALQVTALPQSKVYLDGKYIGQTPLCRCNSKDMIRVGNYTIKLVPSTGGFSEFQEKITISKSILTVVDRKFGFGAGSEGSIITLEKIKQGNTRELLVTSIPDKAEVLLDSASSGFTPLLLHNITDSDHELVLKKSGYVDKKVRIRTPSGYKLTTSVYLGIDQEGIVISPTPTTPSASPSATPTPVGKRVTILQTPTGFLRVRAESTLNSAEVGRVIPGDSFAIVSEISGWYQITLKDGTLGWISSQYVKKE
jgi:hypothetical protein